MRTFGHTETRETREMSIDNQLQDAWTEFISCARSYWSSNDLIAPQQVFGFAKHALEGTSFSLNQLHHFLLRGGMDGENKFVAGWFLSAGYARVPDVEIIFEGEYPWINNLGYNLCGKHLINKGIVGDYLGERMVGKLTNLGTAAKEPGLSMIGTFINHGQITTTPGVKMIGQLINTAHYSHHRPRGNFIGLHNKKWHHVPPKKRNAFIERLENTEHLSYDDLQMEFITAYPVHRGYR